MANISFEESTDKNGKVFKKVDGPLAGLYDNPYEFTNMYYPRNLGSEQRGHYINFYINVAQNSRYIKDNRYTIYDSAGRTATNQAAGPTITAEQFDATTGAIIGATVGAASKKSKDIVDVAVNATTGALIGSGLGALASGGNFSLSRKTKRISKAIALYMPETMNVQYNVDWQSPSLTDAGGLALAAGQISKGASDVVSAFKSGGFSGASKIASDPSTASGIAELLSVPANASGVFGSDVKDFFLYASGSALNPQIEAIFKGVDFRTFQFDFLFSPFDSSESENVLEIIKTFRFHMAPEVNTGLMGRYFTPPSEFDIDFIFNGQINDKVHQIGTCVLQNMNVDYAPNGWSTFYDGMPTQIRMTLQFMETEIVTKQRVDEDNY